MNIFLEEEKRRAEAYRDVRLDKDGDIIINTCARVGYCIPGEDIATLEGLRNWMVHLAEKDDWTLELMMALVERACERDYKRRGAVYERRW